MNRFFTLSFLLVSLAGCALIPDLIPEDQFLNPNDPKSTAYAPVSALPAPENLVAVASNGSVTLSWASVTGATNYKLYWSTISPVDRDTASVETATSSPHVLSGLVNGTVYYFVVSAIVPDGETVSSTEIEATPREFSGTLDDTFGTAGKLALGGYSGGSQATDATVQGNNLFVVGFEQSGYDGFLNKVLAGGSLDAEFGNAGTVSVIIGGADETMPRRVLVDTYGRVVVALDAGPNGAHQPYVLRYLKNGTLDPDFGNAGVVSLLDGLYVDALTLKPDGGLVVALRGSSVGFLLTALTEAGDLDATAFDTDNNGVGDADSQFYAFASMSSVVVTDLVARENASKQLEYWLVYQLNGTVASAQLGHLDALGRWINGGAFDNGRADIDGYTSGFTATDVYEPRLAIDGEDIYVVASLYDVNTDTYALALKKFTGDTESTTLGPNHDLQAVLIPHSGTSEYAYDLAVHDGTLIVLGWDNEGSVYHSWLNYVDGSGVAVSLGTDSSTGVAAGNTTVPLVILPRNDGRVAVVGREGSGAGQQVWVRLVE